MTQPVKAIPDGHHAVTPYLVVHDAEAAIRFYQQAVGAAEVMRFPGPTGKGILHAVIKIGDSLIYLSDEFRDMGSRSPKTLGGTTAGIHLYVEDADAVFQRAVAAGARVRVPLMDIFWGDRFGRVIDPFGYEWAVATHKEDVSPEEIGRRAQVFFAQQAKPQS
jgi:PhnB protein